MGRPRSARAPPSTGGEGGDDTAQAPRGRTPAPPRAATLPPQGAFLPRASRSPRARSTRDTAALWAPRSGHLRTPGRRNFSPSTYNADLTTFHLKIFIKMKIKPEEKIPRTQPFAWDLRTSNRQLVLCSSLDSGFGGGVAIHLHAQALFLQGPRLDRLAVGWDGPFSWKCGHSR